MHSGQAPIGWLKLKRSGVGLMHSVPHSWQVRAFEKSWRVPSSSMAKARPSPSPKAHSSDSVSLLRSCSFTTSLSTITSITPSFVAFSATGSPSELISFVSPPMRALIKPFSRRPFMALVAASSLLLSSLSAKPIRALFAGCSKMSMFEAVIGSDVVRSLPQPRQCCLPILAYRILK